MTPAEITAVADGLMPVVKEIVTAATAPLLARLAALEARPLIPPRDGRDSLVPGPPGEKGDPGPAGEKGAAGLALTAADFARAAFDGARTITLAFGQGADAITVPIVLPIPIYRGVWEETKVYEPADMVTYGGSIWIAAQETNARPSEFFGPGPKAWTLAAKRGRDGKAGKDGPAGKDSAEYVRLMREARL